MDTMRAFSILLILPLAATGLAGCIDGDDGLSGPGVGIVGSLLQARADPLWFDPQNMPHPAYNYPTLTNPPEGAEVPEWWTPIPAAELPSHIAGMELLAPTEGMANGAGIALFGRLAVVPGFGQGPSYVLDISDPTAPAVLGTMDEATRGAAIIPYPDGRLVTVLSTDNLVAIYDITDPTTPERLGELAPTQGSHKVGVVPGTPIVYNAASAGGGYGTGNVGQGTGVTEIYDLSDPENPVHVQDWANGYSCHHIYFYNDASRDFYRAYCAGIEVTQIIDTTDPLDPKVIVNVPVHEGNTAVPSTAVVPARFSHFAIANSDATILIVGDESGGGAAPGCSGNVQTPADQSASGPTGNVYFYDISDEANPSLLGWFNPGPLYLAQNADPAALAGNPFSIFNISCTAHHGRLVPDPEGRDLLAMAFYGAGTVLIDFSDPMNPLMVDQFMDGTSTWEVWYYNGYLMTGDLARGFDVLKFV